MLRFISIFLFLTVLSAGIKKKVIQSDSQTLIFEISVTPNTEADVFPINILIGLPSVENPNIKIDYNDKRSLGFNSGQKLNNELESSSVQKLQNLEVLSLKFSPLASHTEYYKTIRIQIDFNQLFGDYEEPSNNQIEFLEDRIINWTEAKNWFKEKKKTTKRRINSPNGEWIQFFLENDGITSISHSQLNNTASNILNKDPRSFSIFMNNELGRSRTQLINQEIPSNLVELGILITGEEDGVFDLEDKIIFYGRGPSGFNFSENELEWHQNIYFNTNSCWIFIPEDENLRGKRVQQSPQPETGIVIDYGLSKIHLESDLINLEASGTEWVSNSIISGNSQAILLNLDSPKSGVSFNLKARIKGHSITETSSSYHSISLHYGSINNDFIGSPLNWSGNSFRNLNLSSNSINLINGMNFFYLKNSSSDNNSSPYIDYNQFEYGRELNFSNEYDFISPITGQNIRFLFSGQNNLNFYLWDISDPINPKTLIIGDDNFCNVNVSSSQVGHFIGFDITTIDEISNLTLNNSQKNINLRNPELLYSYVIIGPENFRELTKPLLDLRSPAIYASLEDIYNEFSAGNKDPMAIRTFIQWTQEKWLAPNPNCLLLLGDAGYDYRNITGNSSIIVPTNQVQSNRSYATDDLFVTLYGNLPEIATGRFPARNSEEVNNFIDKVLDIELNSNFGPWRQRITLIADDAARPEPTHGSINTGKSHTLNTEQLAQLVPPGINVKKLYMLEYPEVGDASAYGVIKPDATRDLFNYLNDGTAIISYIGHGSPTQLAQERLLDLGRGDLNQINNSGKLPIWIVGTCSFGHFDDPLTESFSEELIRDPMNSASIVISTTRPITVVGNERYTQDLFENIFKDNKVNDSKIGIILQSIKDGSNESKYFHLFGDPALKIPMPKSVIESISIYPDTLVTLGIGSFIAEQSIIEQNGKGFVSFFDADRLVTRDYEILSETYSLTYNLTGPTLFRGKFSFNGTNLEGKIRIPKDISYSNDPAKLTIYIHDNENELLGSLNNIILAGGSDSSDYFGPQITFENTIGQRLENGDHLSIEDDLIVRLSDPMGINLTNDPGHEILILDLQTNQSENFTDQFFYDLNSITTGTIKYSANNSEININIKAWDSANNPNNKEILLFKQNQNQLNINNIYNFPNPFSNFTQFTFEINQTCDVKIDIFSIGGRKVKSFKINGVVSGFHTVDWNGLDFLGGQIANGVYIYRIKVIGENSSITRIERCAKYG